MGQRRRILVFSILLMCLGIFAMCFSVIGFCLGTSFAHNQFPTISPTIDTTFESINPYPFVVNIRVPTIVDDQKKTTWGTGFVTDKERGFVVTAKHVVDGDNLHAHKIRVYGRNRFTTYARVVWKHPEEDVAVAAASPAERGRDTGFFCWRS